jgi:hypothetical protein
MRLRIVSVVLLGLLRLMDASAQSTLQQNLSSNKLPTLSGNASLGYNSNLYEKSAYSYSSSTSADLTLNYRVTGAHLMRAVVSGFQEHTQGQETKLNDGFIGWVNNGFWHRGDVITFGQQVRLNLPYSKDSRDRDTKVVGVSVVPIIMANMAPLGLKNLLLIYLPQAIKNFHTYTVNRAGVSNSSYAFNHTLVGFYSPTDKIYFQPVFVYGQAWTYNNRKKDDVYQFAFETGFIIGKGLTAAAGWSNAGAIRNFENGNDQTVQLFNNETSTLYGALYYVF